MTQTPNKSAPNFDRATSHFPPKDDDIYPPAVAEVVSPHDLSVLQARIGGWALKTFGPTPAAVHVARMDREMADVHDCVAMGNMDDLGRALAGVFVVGLALADSHDIDLTRALLAEQDDNESSEWIQDSWGQWLRNGDGAVKDDHLARDIAAQVKTEGLDAKFAARLLMDRGASLTSAADYIQDHAGVASDAFQNPRAEDIRPEARGVSTKFNPLAGRTMPKGDTVTAPANLEVGL